MNIIIALLAVIAVSEIVRLVLTHKKSSKKKHFKQKIEGTQKMIWDMEFKKFKTREIREEIRGEHSFMMARIDALDKQIKDCEDKVQKGGLEDQKVRAERDAKRLEAQMKQLDVEAEGSKPSNEYPDGVTGITQQIDSLRELVDMLKSWIKQI